METNIVDIMNAYLDIKATENPEYNLNIIDELHANENAHTRILLKLPEVCVPNCKCNAICNKIQKDTTLFK